MAEGWVKKIFPEKVSAFSAGIAAEKEVDPYAVKVMAEVGIDISGAKPKSVDVFRGENFDFVITVCNHAKETCPLWLGKGERIHEGFEDPPVLAKDAKNEKEALKIYREVRDEIKKFILKLKEIV